VLDVVKSGHSNFVRNPFTYLRQSPDQNRRSLIVGTNNRIGRIFIEQPTDKARIRRISKFSRYGGNGASAPTHCFAASQQPQIRCGWKMRPREKTYLMVLLSEKVLC